MFWFPNLYSSILFNISPTPTIISDIPKTFTNKTFSFLYHYLSISFSPIPPVISLSFTILISSIFLYSSLIFFFSFSLFLVFIFNFIFFLYFSCLLYSSFYLFLYSLFNHSFSCSFLFIFILFFLI